MNNLKIEVNDKISIMDGFIKYLMSQKRKKPNTGRYVNIVRKFHNYIGKSYIDVETDDIENYFHFLTEYEELKIITIYRHLKGIKLFYDYLLTKGNIRSNPCESIRIKI